MIIPDVAPDTTYTVGGSPQSVFVVPFPFFADGDLIVTVGTTVMTLTTDYTLTGAGSSSGGSLTLLVAVSNTTVRVQRDIPVARTTDFPAAGPLNIESLNTELDRQTAMIQQVEARVANPLQPTVTVSAAMTPVVQAATTDAAAALLFPTGTFNLVPQPGGRITPVSGNPFVTADVVDAQTIYYAPCVSDRVPIISSSLLVLRNFLSSATDQVGPSLSLGTSANFPAGTLWDIFAYWTGSAVALCARQWDAGMLYTEAQITNVTPITTGTGATAWTNTSKAFDGTDAQSTANSTVVSPSNNSIANCLGQDWGAGNEQTVSRIEIKTPTDNGLRNDEPTLLRCHVSDSTDGTNWRLIQLVDLNDGSVANTHSIPINQAVWRPVRYMRMAFTGNGAASLEVAEMKFFKRVAPANGRRLTRYRGLLVNDAALTNARTGPSTTVNVAQYEATYLGTIHITTGGNGKITCHVDYGPARAYDVWNAYNQRPIRIRGGSHHTETSVTANYSTNITNTVFADMEASGLFQVEVLDGLGAGDPIMAELPRTFFIDASAAGASYTAGIGVDTKLSVSGIMISDTIDSVGPIMAKSAAARHTLRREAGLRTLYGIEKKGQAGTTSIYYTGEQLSALQATWMG